MKELSFFLMGLGLGFMMAGIAFSRYTDLLVTKIDNFIDRKLKERKERKDQKEFEKKLEEYLEVQRRLKW